MPSWILIGRQRDSNLSLGREATDGFSTSNVPRCSLRFSGTDSDSFENKRVRSPSFTFASFLALAVQCPAHDVRYDSSGVILSPGWPESYPNLQMCSWSVNVEKGYNVTITFESFHTEREFDVLEIFDGNRNNARCTNWKIIWLKGRISLSHIVIEIWILCS